MQLSFGKGTQVIYGEAPDGSMSMSLQVDNYGPHCESELVVFRKLLAAASDQVRVWLPPACGWHHSANVQRACAERQRLVRVPTKQGLQQSQDP